MRVVPWRELDSRDNEVEIKMNARALDAAAVLRAACAPGLYFLPAGARGAKAGVALRRCGPGRMDGIALPVMASCQAGVAEHAQVQRDSSDKKDYGNEVFLQSSPIPDKVSTTTMV